MPETAPQPGPLPERQFAALVDEWKADPARSAMLMELLREDNPVYNQRGTGATVRMRGWVLLAFEWLGLPEAALLFVLEELDNGRDAYLVAAAARVLRSCATPSAAMAPFLIRAIANIRDHDDRVCLKKYGGYATSDGGATAVKEALDSLLWLGPHAHGVLADLEALHANRDGQFPSFMKGELRKTIDAIRGFAPGGKSREEDCCSLATRLGSIRLWPGAGDAKSIESAVFEDQDGARIGFGEFFRGRPSVVVFYYSRCGNPRKCSLTVAKLARVQKLLAERGLEGRIRTAAITYDPEFDLPERMRGYGQSRGLRMDNDHRMLRATTGMSGLREHFHLGVNFIESLVNRHRVEVYVLNAAGQIASSFERIQWDEHAVIEQAAGLLDSDCSAAPHSENGGVAREAVATGLGVLAAFFPKCPMCWAAYLSIFGIASLQQLAYARWVLPLLAGLMLINLVGLWLRGRSRGRMAGFYFAAAGALSILVIGIGLDVPFAGPCGVVLTLTGSLLNAFSGFTPAAIFRRFSPAR